MTSPGSKALELMRVAVRGFFDLHESQAWRLFDLRAFLLPVACTALVYWLMGAEQRHPRAVVFALSLLVVLSTTSVRLFSVDRGLGLVAAVAAYAAFKFDRRWGAQTIALALGAMLVGFEARAWHDATHERRAAVAHCEANGGVLVRRRIRGVLVCLAPSSDVVDSPATALWRSSRDRH